MVQCHIKYRRLLCQFFFVLLFFFIPSSVLNSQEVFSVQAGAFSSIKNAVNVVRSLEDLGVECIIYETEGLYKVYCGEFVQKRDANKLISKLSPSGYKSSFVVSHPSEPSQSGVDSSHKEKIGDTFNESSQGKDTPIYEVIPLDTEEVIQPGEVAEKETILMAQENEEEKEEEAEEAEEVPTPPAPLKPPETKPGVKPEIKPEDKEIAPVSPVPPEAKQPEIKEATPPVTLPPKVERKPTPGEVSFFFDDADVYEVIQTVFGEILKVNYIVDPKIRGRVNFRTTTPIPRDKVLPVMEIILRLNGIAVVEEMGLYRIISITDIPKEPAPIRFGRDPETVELKGIAIVQVVQLQYISSSEILKILTPLLSQGGTILDVPPSFLIIADTDANVKRLLQVVEIFDSEKLRLARPQVFVYPVQNSKAKDVAALLQQIFLGERPTEKAPTTPKSGQPSPQPSAGLIAGEALVSEGTRIFPDEVTNTIIILATPEDFATIAATIKKIDLVPRQVVIEALIARLDLTDSLSFGLAWSLKTDITVKPFRREINLSGEMGQRASALLPAEGATDVTLSGDGFTFLATDPSGIVRARLDMLATEGKVKVLASPHILVSDNREASIQVGQQVPIKTSETFTTGQILPTSTFQYKDLGIILKVKPQVNEGGLVSLEITQEISSSATSTEDLAGGAFAVINKTEASTNLVVQDGQTIIIGGLIREDTDKSRTGIPFLSKIPILGYLFGSTTTSSSRNELIILLTPHVMRTQQDAKKITSDYIDRFISVTQEIKREELIKEQSP